MASRDELCGRGWSTSDRPYVAADAPPSRSEQYYRDATGVHLWQSGIMNLGNKNVVSHRQRHVETSSPTATRFFLSLSLRETLVAVPCGSGEKDAEKDTTVPCGSGVLLQPVFVV